MSVSIIIAFISILVTLLLASVAALWKISFSFSAVVTKVDNIEGLLAKGQERMEQHDVRIGDHGERIVKLETRAGL